MSDDEVRVPRVERPVAERLGRTTAAEVARAALNRARAGAEARGLRPGAPVRRRRQAEVQLSSAARDGRDPALVGDAVDRLVAQLGWRAELSVGGLIGRWREFVGPDIAEHCTPETFEEGLLVVRTDSTSWAKQVQFLAPQLLARLEQELGPDVVREVRAVGPGGRQWGKGPRRVPGRGPRDTYG
ncbi:DciA family protein [Actinotalea sp. AC32]|nr:DciA family protein [Actinotalea sp. AC32]